MSQVFDDLRARNALGAFVDDRSVPRDIRVTITQFVFALDHYGNQNKSDDVAFSSGEWRAVEASAKRVTEALTDAREAGYELE